jgi:hypothetical protein
MKEEKEEEMKFLYKLQDTHYMMTKQAKKLEKKIKLNVYSLIDIIVDCRYKKRQYL